MSRSLRQRVTPAIVAFPGCTFVTAATIASSGLIEETAESLRDFRLPPESAHILICFERVELPRIDDLLPFDSEKAVAKFVVRDFSGCRSKHFWDVGTCRDFGFAKPGLIESDSNWIDGMHVNSFAKSRLVADEPAELRSQGVRERVGKCGQQNPYFRICASPFLYKPVKMLRVDADARWARPVKTRLIPSSEM
jgi:hypothetical protein